MSTDIAVKGATHRRVDLVGRAALRPGEVAEALGVSRDTVDRLISRGELKSWTLGRARFVSVDELRRFVREREEAC